MQIYSRSHNTPYKGPQIKSGSVVRTYCHRAGKEKWFIVVGSDTNGYLCLAVLLNTKKPFQNTKELADLQLLITKKAVGFIDHDSYVNCAHPEVKSLEELQDAVTVCSSNYWGNMPEDELKRIQGKVANASTIAPKTIRKFGLSSFVSN